MSHRTWMYSGWQRGKAPSSEWIEQTNQFLDHAFSNMEVATNDTIKCPCAMCRNYFRFKRDTIAIHLCKHGFREGYETWTEHGESHIRHDEIWFGQHKGTPINTFAAMKSGMKNIDSNGNCGPINSNKAQQCMDDYIAGVKGVTQAHREDEEDGEHEQHEEHEDMEEVEQGQGQGQEQGPGHELELNAKVLYDVSGGMSTHGRFAIGNGAFRAADVRAVGKEKNVSQSNSVSMQMLAQQNAQLRRENARLRQEKGRADSALQQSKVAQDLTMGLYQRLGWGQEILEASLRVVSAAAAQANATGSSHVGSESTNDDNAANVYNEENLNGTIRGGLGTLNCHIRNHA